MGSAKNYSILILMVFILCFFIIQYRKNNPVKSAAVQNPLPHPVTNTISTVVEPQVTETQVLLPSVSTLDANRKIIQRVEEISEELSRMGFPESLNKEYLSNSERLHIYKLFEERSRLRLELDRDKLRTIMKGV